MIGLWLFLSLLFYAGNSQILEPNLLQPQKADNPFDIFIEQRSKSVQYDKPSILSLDAILKILNQTDGSSKVVRPREGTNTFSFDESSMLQQNNDLRDHNSNSDIIVLRPVKTKNSKLSINTDAKTTNTIKDKTNDTKFKVVTEQPSVIQKIVRDTKKKVSSDGNNNKTEVVKEKIYNLFKETNTQLYSKLKAVDTIHQLFKSSNLYRIGFVVSYINRTSESMANLFKYVDNNKNKWDLLTILNAYVKIKKTKDFLMDMLAVLNVLLSNNARTPGSNFNKKSPPIYRYKTILAFLVYCYLKKVFFR